MRTATAVVILALLGACFVAWAGVPAGGAEQGAAGAGAPPPQPPGGGVAPVEGPPAGEMMPGAPGMPGAEATGPAKKPFPVVPVAIAIAIVVIIAAILLARKKGASA